VREVERVLERKLNQTTDKKLLKQFKRDIKRIMDKKKIEGQNDQTVKPPTTNNKIG